MTFLQKQVKYKQSSRLLMLIG